MITQEIQEYCEQIIRTAKHNGLTNEQILNNLDLCVEANYEAQKQQWNEISKITKNISSKDFDNLEY